MKDLKLLYTHYRAQPRSKRHPLYHHDLDYRHCHPHHCSPHQCHPHHRHLRLNFSGSPDTLRPARRDQSGDSLRQGLIHRTYTQAHTCRHIQTHTNTHTHMHIRTDTQLHTKELMKTQGLN